MIHRGLDLFYKVFNAIDQHYQKQIRFFSLILLSLSKLESKNASIILYVSLPVVISMLSLLEYKVRILLLVSLEDIKLIAIINWIFHSLWVL